MPQSAQDEIDRLLGIQKPPQEQPAKDPRFASALAEEHGVTELKPTSHHDGVTDCLETLLGHVNAAPADRQIPALLGGLSRLLNDCRAEGPGVVDHLSKAMWTAAAGIIDGVLKG